MINAANQTSIAEIADGIYRISTPVPPSAMPGGFTFNQFLIKDTDSLLFHTGLRKMFPVVLEAVKSVIPVSNLRYVSFSHVEADECGSLNEWLAAAVNAVPLCGQIAAQVSIADMADRPPRVLRDGEKLSLGTHTVTWFDMPHLPHAWECGYLMEETTKTLLCGDLFTQGGHDLPAVTREDILEPSEVFRRSMDYYSQSKDAGRLLNKLAEASPETLACMHGSTWKGDGSKLLRALAERLK